LLLVNPFKESSFVNKNPSTQSGDDTRLDHPVSRDFVTSRVLPFFAVKNEKAKRAFGESFMLFRKLLHGQIIAIR